MSNAKMNFTKMFASIALIVYSTFFQTQAQQSVKIEKGKSFKGDKEELCAGLSKSFLVSGKISQTFSYCGGAKPPEELLKKMATPIPYPGKKLYVRAGKTNDISAKIVADIITDSAGMFLIRLRSGIYSIIVEEQLHQLKDADYTTTNQRVDNKCLQDWWSKPYSVLEIKDKNLHQLNFTFHHRCYVTPDIPCITYTGPPHP